MIVNLNSDVVSRNCIESGAYLLYSLRYEFQILYVNASLDDGVSHTIFSWTVTLILTSDLALRIIVSRAYLLR